MIQIFHHYKLWEDYKHGFYDNSSGNKKKELIKKTIELFSNENLTRKYMEKVVSEWTYSMEHNLSNPSMNKIAYLGQAACCLYANIPNIITMNAWNLVDIEKRNKADVTANLIIKQWEQSQRFLNISITGKKKDILMEYQMKLHFN